MSFTSETVCSAKVAVAEMLFEAGCEEVRVPTKTWFRLMESEQSIAKELWLTCLENAAPALIDEGFVKAACDNATCTDMVDWKRVPSSLFAAVVLGLDCLVTTEDGDTVGVITTVTKDGEKDLDDLIKLRPLLDYLGLDALVWCKVSLPANEVECLTHYTNLKKQLVNSMSQMLTDLDSEWVHSWVIEAAPIEVTATATSTSTVNPTVTINPTATI